ncbi:hypothetical protein SDC9_60534 [bioreactor metagenome]|uniref:Uncharacterized protein n=1 Tax=bioreactor metagenome TaxID=1076179 RepID=A0A644XJB5_9ZZZZ
MISGEQNRVIVIPDFFSEGPSEIAFYPVDIFEPLFLTIHFFGYPLNGLSVLRKGNCLLSKFYRLIDI